MPQAEIEKSLKEASLCLQPERPQSLAGAAKLRAHSLLMMLNNAKPK